MLLARLMFADDVFYLGVGTAISVIIWLTVLIYWAGNFFYRLEGLQVLVVPPAAVLSLLPLALPAVHPVSNTHFAAFKAHSSLYPASDALIAAIGKARGPHVIKSRTIRFPIDQPVPLALIARIARLRAKEQAKQRLARGS